MYKKIVYTYLGNTYDDFDKIKRLLPNVSWPLNPTDEQLENLVLKEALFDLDCRKQRRRKLQNFTLCTKRNAIDRLSIKLVILPIILTVWKQILTNLILPIMLHY